MAAETHTVPRADAGQRLDRWLARTLALPLPQARALAAEGRVHIRGKACSPLRRLFGGEAVEVRRPAPRPVEATGPELPVLHDDADVVVVDKPAGLAAEPPPGGGPSAVSAAARLGRFDVAGRAAPGLAHRLDRGTSGCLMMARSDRALAALKAAFAAGAVEKEYLALVAGAPPEEGTLDTPHGRDPEDPRRFTGRLPSPRRARLAFRVEERFPGAALLRVRLLTGRTHQIRVQLSEAGWPVLGDAVYGRRSPVIERQALHAERLALPHPATGERLEVKAPLPADLREALEALRRGARA